MHHQQLKVIRYVSWMPTALHPNVQEKYPVQQYNFETPGKRQIDAKQSTFMIKMS